MKISKTAIFGWVTTVLGGLALVGVDLPVDQITALMERITDDILSLYMLISGPLILYFRKITNSPVAKGILGFLGLKEKE